MVMIVIDDGSMYRTRKMEVKAVWKIIKMIRGKSEYEAEWKLK